MNRPLLFLISALSAVSSPHAVHSFSSLQTTAAFTRPAAQRGPRPWSLSLSSSSVEEAPLPPSAASDGSSDDDSASSTGDGSDRAAPPIPDQVEKWRREAERIRLEAEQMDISLTLQKLAALQEKLDNPKTADRWKTHPEEQQQAQDQLRQLQLKIKGPQDPPTKQQSDSSKSKQVSRTTSSESSTKSDKDDKGSGSNNKPPALKSLVVTPRDLEKSRESRDKKSDKNANSKRSKSTPIAGFDQEDLELYIPIAWELEERLPNATLPEKMEIFRTDPRLQQHFQQKITALLVQPIQDMQRLEELRDKYLYSRSSKEKQDLKRQIVQLEQSLVTNGPVSYSDEIFKNIPPMVDLSERLAAVSSLPPTLQAVYKSRNKIPVDDTGSLELAIQLDYYDEQLQLLEQAPAVLPVTKDLQEEVVLSVESLPPAVRKHLAKKWGLDVSDDANDVEVQVLAEKISTAKSTERREKRFQEFKKGAFTVTAQGLKHNDIEFVDRSRYITDLYPTLARMEGVHPPEEAVSEFMSKLLDRKTFMVVTKPERVMGGYYIRGQNLIADDDSGVKLTARLRDRLDASSMKDKIEFYYILDPEPLSDESLEMGNDREPLLFVTSKNSTAMYDLAAPLTKLAVSSLGLLSLWIFTLATCTMQPLLQERIDTALVSKDLDLSWLADITYPTLLSMLVIQFTHEAAHRLVAWKDKFEVGLPTPIPSIQLGLQGAITPLKSPPPGMRSMFDFAMAGPLTGLVASMAFLISGLAITASAETSNFGSLPALPVFLLQSSALGGGLTEFFLGKGVLGQGIVENSMLQLHPFAISGFTGLLANALALLPLGHTDGGRIALAMFGRFGAYLVNVFTAILLCLAGLVGLDRSHILLTYILFVSIWQRDLESPVRNEVEELDMVRGTLGISVAIIVALILLPF